MSELNGYVCFYRGKRAEVYAETAYQAQEIAAKQLRARKAYEVVVMLASTASMPTIIHDGAELP